MEQTYDLIVIGGAPAGYTAALYAVRAGLRTLVLEKSCPGGQMAQAHRIDNYPGFEQGIEGFELSLKMQACAHRFGAVTLSEGAEGVHLEGSTKRIETGSGTFLAKAVIIATGAGHRQLGLGEEERFLGRGLSYCASCDGAFYRGKTVAVVGGGNSAVSDALQLCRICSKVYLIHRRDSLRSSKVDSARLLACGNIQPLWNRTVTRLIGTDRLTGLETRDVNSGEQSLLEVEGVFVSIGRQPATGLFEGQLALDGSGYILAGEDTCTGLPGVFAAGDVRTKPLRQIVTAAADGAVAAHQAQVYLSAPKAPD